VGPIASLDTVESWDLIISVNTFSPNVYKWLYYSQTTLCMLSHEDSCTTYDDMLELIYFIYFHSILSYGLICWENSTDKNKVLNIQKKIIRKIEGVQSWVSSRKLFWRLIYFWLKVNTYSAYCHLWWKTWKNFKEMWMYTNITNMTFIPQMIMSLNIRKEYTTQIASHSIIFDLQLRG
jgi:hypothetical protein